MRIQCLIRNVQILSRTVWSEICTFARRNLLRRIDRWSKFVPIYICCIMKRVFATLCMLALLTLWVSCTNSNDGLDYLKGSTAIWLGTVDSINMANFGSALSVSGGNQNIVKATTTGSVLVLEGVNTGLTTLFISTDRVFIEMMVRVRGLMGYWGVTTNDKYGISVQIDPVQGADSARISQTSRALVEKYSALLAGAGVEFGRNIFMWSNGSTGGEGSWQLSGNSLVLTAGGVARTLGFEVYDVDRVRLSADVTEEALSLYPDDGILTATMNFFLDRRIVM